MTRNTTRLRFPRCAAALCALVVALIAARVAGNVHAAEQWKAADGGNDHFYEAVLVSGGISWNSAAAAANAAGGYLATPVSAAENEFIIDLVDDLQYWVALTGPDRVLGPYLGGFQPLGSAEPGGGWEWLNGDGGFGVEDLGAFQNWHAFEPNNIQGGNENALQYFTLEGPPSSFWNDIRAFDSTDGIAYVVEWDTNPVPEPSTIGLAALGIIGLLLRRKRQRVAYAGIVFCSVAILTTEARAVTIPTVLVGNAGNASDPTDGDASTAGIQNYGAVPYNYRIGTTEVTNAQYAEFLNAKAASDPLDLYNVNMGSNARGGITRSGSGTIPDPYVYATKTDMGNKPVNYVSWYDAIRFANWLNNGQGSGDTETGTYTLLGGTSTPSNGSAITRNGGATWFLTSENEWYKAAYCQPAAQGGDVDNYWLYPTASNSVPTFATANSVGDISNPGTNVANYNSGADWNSQDGNVTTVGSAGPLSDSFYGTADQGGNVYEWNEALISSGSFRSLRGGAVGFGELFLTSSRRSLFNVSERQHSPFFGFRVATVPEPSTLALATAGILAMAVVARRRAVSSLMCAPGIRLLALLSAAAVCPVIGLSGNSAWAGVLTYGDLDVLGTGSYLDDPLGDAMLEGLATDEVTFGPPIPHTYPFDPELGEFPGTDQIYTSTAPTTHGDGYSHYSGRLTGPQVFALDYSALVPTGRSISTFTLGIAADDFQRFLFGQPFTASINGAFNFTLTLVFNSLYLTGPQVQFFSIGLAPSTLTPDHVLTVSIDQFGDGAYNDGWAVDFLTVGVTTIPEPTSAVLVATGIFALLAFCWRGRPIRWAPF